MRSSAARSRIAAVAALSVLFAGLGLPAVEAAEPQPKIWTPPNTPLPTSAPVQGTSLGTQGKQATPTQKWMPPAEAAPSGTATEPLVSGSETPPRAAKQAGNLPVWIAPSGDSNRTGKTSTAPSAQADDAKVRVDVADAGKAAATGVSGALISLTDTGTGTAPGKVQVGLDISAWAKTAGANWGDRARLVQLPACALASPQAAGCRTRTPVASKRDTSGRLTAEVEMPFSMARSTVKSPMMMAVSAPQGVVLAVEPGPSGSTGDYKASPLNPSASWQAGANAGNFTYGYTVEVPSAIAGPAPSISLGYDSSSVDGKTASTNAQASWIGDGWDYHPGSISRTYKSCDDAGVKDSGDDCWGGDLLNLSLAGHAGQLVRDDKSCAWHLQGEDGTKVERLTGQANGAWSGEGFKVTTTDGSQFYFGANHLPGGDGSDPAANSVSTVPVYWPGDADKCLGSGSPAKGSWSQMGWQWNLDYVVDAHQNLITYRYAQENNYYGKGGGQNNGNGTPTLYQRGSYPTWIGYGQRLPDQIKAKGAAKPAAQVWFRTKERCVPGGSVTCADDQRTKENAKYWPDSPLDQVCGATGQCLNLSPTFWTTKQLTRIDTEVLDGTYRSVDSFALNQSFQDPKDGTSPSLWLDSVQRTGSNGKTPVTLPAVSFTPLQIANRVDGNVVRPDGTEASAPSYKRPRIQTITTETGGKINVIYRPAECSRTNKTMPSSADQNTMACMPVKWYLPGQSYPDPVDDWFNKIVIQSVTEQDTFGTAVPKVTDYEYGGGIAWHRNDSELTDAKTRTWDQFRGYATVTTRTGSGNLTEAPRTKSVSTYLRGMDGDILANGSKRSVSVDAIPPGTTARVQTITDDNVLSGFVRQTQTYDSDGGTLVGSEITTPWQGAVTATRAQSGGMPEITARAVNTGKVTTYSKLADGGWRTAERTSTYDDTLASRPVQVDDKSDLSHPEQRLCTAFTYATGPLSQLAVRTLTLKGACDQTPDATNTVADTRSYFDNKPLGETGSAGDQTATEVLERYGSDGKPAYRKNVTSAFDVYGRVVSTTDPQRTDADHPGGATTKTEYSPDTGALPNQVVHTSPLGWKSTTTFDIGRSIPVKQTDANNHIAEQDYDALGRVTAVWQPGAARASGAAATRKFSYAMNGTNAPSTVLSQALTDDAPTYTSSFTIYDGLGRIRQTQASTPSGVYGRTITDALFDSHGWQTKTSAAYYNNEAAPSGQLFLPNGGVNPDSKVLAQSIQVYDGLGRTTATVFQSYGVEQWRSKSEYPGADETRHIPPTGGYATATLTDGLGQTVALRQYQSNTPTGAYDETTYGYNAQGKEQWRKDPAGNEWTSTYDLLGRLVKTSDPDAGTATTTYDDSKNLATTTDARGKSATTVVDLLGRTSATYEGTAIDPTKQVGKFTYDTLALGKPTASTRFVGGANGSAYVSEITGYDNGYHPFGTKTTIPKIQGEEGLAGTYSTSNTYDALGHLKSTTLPAIAGMAAETLNYGVDIVGNMTSLDGKIGLTRTPYVVDLRYDPYGRAIRTTVGGTGAQIVATQDYDNSTGRLIRSTLDKQNAPNASVDVTDYTYNQVGQITSVRDAQDGAASDLQCFTHDYLGRLSQAWTDTGTQTTAPQPNVRGIGSCANSDGPAVDGTGKPSVGGPAPYWQKYTYDKLGNRKQLVKKDVTGDTSKDVTVNQTFGSGPNTPSSDPKTGGGTGGPHALLSSTETGPSGTQVTSYTYDATGNTASITSTPGTKSLTWNGQGKLDKITGTGESAGTSYLYDTAGNQLIRRDPGKTTLNLGPDQPTLDTASGKVTNIRTYGAPGGLSITRTTTDGKSTLAYQAADPHGTNGVQLNATDLAQVRRPTDPFGNERGMQPADGAWAGNKGFVGGTKEQATGLTLLGAREYDAKAGRFISPDPIIDASDPQQWNAYAYSNNNPINSADPDGKFLFVFEIGQYIATTLAKIVGGTTKGETDAQAEVDRAGQAVAQGKRKRDELQHQVINIIGDLIGYNDARDCFTKGDVMACINTALGAVPWGKIFKAVKVGIKAFKIYKEINKTYNAIRDGERLAAKAAEAYSRAKKAGDEARAAEKAAAKAAEEKAAKESAEDAASTESKSAKAESDAETHGSEKGDAESAGSCSVKTNSFPAGTRVLMANGTTKTMEDLRVGDKVMATDPQTGETRPETVTATITTPDDKDFTDLALTNDANPRGPPAKVTSTYHHPYWSETRHQWVDAGELHIGEQLRQPDGAMLTVTAARNYRYAVTTHNLTVDRLHTYYVLAGAAAVLVHNCGTGDPLVGQADELRNEPGVKFVSEYTSPSGQKYYGRNKHGQQASGPLGKALEDVGHHGGCAEVHCLIQAQEKEGADAIRGGNMRTVKSKNNSMPTSNTAGHGEPATPCGRCERLLDYLDIG
ncbi:tRNA(Glu)-specific nuclease WapA [Streptomyces hundungensis]|uniref:tRNA(Glu)-specific nuclease WapA n=1 Tax=Streptomyces hundungensis TaxID=1077946 RepID=A0A387H3K3_9ACTN|nr:RHS repeat-associated core domain-containing protein [Streptomyces hundungensis]AYG78265.1 tRNA(Glu)-specific nuclease WapA [Streptomyces hundungensis]